MRAKNKRHHSQGGGVGRRGMHIIRITKEMRDKAPRDSYTVTDEERQEIAAHNKVVNAVREYLKEHPEKKKPRPQSFGSWLQTQKKARKQK